MDNTKLFEEIKSIKERLTELETKETYRASHWNVGTGTLAGAGDLSVDGKGVFTGGSPETALGYKNARVGAESDTPRIVFEDDAGVLWEIDNDAGTFRFFTPGVVAMTMVTGSAGHLVGIGTTPVCELDVLDGTIRGGGANGPSAGAGVELQFASDIGYVTAYDRDASAYRTLYIRGDPVYIREGGTTLLTIDGGDVYTEAWTNYAASSTIIGWTAPTAAIYYMRIGKLVFVNFLIEGTSNNTASSFTLPHANGNGANGKIDITSLRWMDNTTWGTVPGLIEMNNGSATVSLYPGMGGGNWTASNQKRVYGQFFYRKS